MTQRMQHKDRNLLEEQDELEGCPHGVLVGGCLYCQRLNHIADLEYLITCVDSVNKNDNLTLSSIRQTMVNELAEYRQKKLEP